MGVAMSLVLHDGDHILSKPLGHAMPTLDSIALSLGLPALEDLLSMSDEEHADFVEDFGESDELAPANRWQQPALGLEWVRAVKGGLVKDGADVQDLPAVLADLEAFEASLQAAESNGTKWYFALDI